MKEGKHAIALVRMQQNHLSLQFQISTLCQTCYERTLSKHHNWLVRKCVGMATHLLASRDYLLSAIIKEGPGDEEEVLEAISRLVLVTEKVCARVQHIYGNRNILDLS